MLNPAACVRRLRALSIRLFVPLALMLAGPAHALEPHQLAGWWIAVDDVFPKAWARRDLVPAEELLIIGRDGRAENRMMNFWAGHSAACADSKVCADAPLVATARVRVKGERVTFVERNETQNRLDAAHGDGLTRRLVVTANATWTGTLRHDVLTLRQVQSATTRTFARIDPDRLRRLRAGLRVAALAPAKHWRCFLANATARDPAFAPLRAAREQEARAPDFLARYLKVAAYAAALDDMLAMPTPDDPDEKTRKQIGFETERLLALPYDDIRLPVSLADKQRLHAKLMAINERAKALSSEAKKARAEARADAKPDSKPDIRPPAAAAAELPLGDADLAAFAQALGNGEEAKKLFCRD